MTKKQKGALGAMQTAHIVALVLGAFTALFAYGTWIVFLYLIWFFISEYFYLRSQTEIVNQDKKFGKFELAYAISSMSLNAILLFVLLLPEILNGTWSFKYGMLDVMYLIFIGTSLILLISFKWVRKMIV